MKKKDLTTAGIYLVIGVICFAALVLTDSKLDSLPNWHAPTISCAQCMFLPDSTP